MTAWRLVLGLSACVLVSQAAAQDRNTQVLMERVDRLERALNDMSRQVYRGEPPRAVAPGAASSGGASFDGAGYAQLESRLAQNEEQMRRLTGQMEEIDFRLRRMTERLDKLASDVDFRLKAIEQGRGGESAAAAPGAPSGALASAPPAEEPQQAPTSVVPPGLVIGPQPVKPAPAPSSSQSAAATAPVKLPDGSPKEQYDYAYGLLRKASFPEAEQAFHEFLKRNPDDKLAANAHYWLGETYYVRDQYEQAALAFVEGYKKFPDGAKAPDTLYKLGLTLHKLNQKQEACATFGELLHRFPDVDARMKQRAEAERKELACR
jgi:tol-pal system protein YbgF